MHTKIGHFNNFIIVVCTLKNIKKNPGNKNTEKNYDYCVNYLLVSITIVAKIFLMTIFPSLSATYFLEVLTYVM